MMFVKSLAFCAMAKAVAAIPATTEIYHHYQTERHIPNGIWVFSSEGLSILSVDGSQILKTLSVADLGCGANGCFYFDIVTDGHTFVWANAMHSSPHRIDTFSLDTGDYLGGIASCSTPLSSTYVVNREELWIRCAGSGTEQPDGDHVRVVPANTLGGAFQDIHISDGRAYGHAVFHSSLGNFGYATSGSHDVIFKIDLAHRMPVANFTMDRAQASYDVTYSADIATCGRFGSGSPGQNIQTGPSAGRTDLNGTCGVSCEGSAADTLGVLEFDTVSDQFVGSHTPLVGFGATPQASPDGKYIVLFANDGGQSLRVLKAENNGATSSIAFDVPLDFANVPPGARAISDFAFVNWKNHDLLALASGYDNDLVLVDLSDSPPAITKLRLSDSATQTGENGGRMVEWAYGTDYLWIDAAAAQELYVVKLSEDGSVARATVERTVQNVASSKMIYVENFARRAQMDMLGQSLQPSALVSEGFNEQKKEPSNVSVVALAIGLASLVFNFFLIVYLSNKTAKPSPPPPEGPVSGETDDKTLGSKNVA